MYEGQKEKVDREEKSKKKESLYTRGGRNNAIESIWDESSASCLIGYFEINGLVGGCFSVQVVTINVHPAVTA